MGSSFEMQIPVPVLLLPSQRLRIHLSCCSWRLEKGRRWGPRQGLRHRAGPGSATASFVIIQVYIGRLHLVPILFTYEGLF